MSSHRRRTHRSRSHRHRQWALWALAAMLVVALISSRLWLAQQSALENAAQQMPAAQTATVLPPAAKVTPAPSPALPNHPELLPKPERSPTA